MELFSIKIRCTFQLVSTGQMNISPENIREFPILPCYKDWNDALLGKTNPEYLKETEGLVNPIEVRHSGQDEEERQTSYHR